MDILGLIGRLFGLTHEEPEFDSDQPNHDETATAVLEPPDDGLLDAEHQPESPEDGPAPDPNAWWLPRTDLPLPDRARGGAIDQSLHEHLLGVLKDPDVELPRLPHAAQRALAMLADEDLDFGKLARVVEQDPAITARILRVANSVAYRGIVEVTRLDLAFARLGRREVRSLILALSVNKILITTGGTQRSRGQGLWERAVAAGVIVEQFSDPQKTTVSEAFLLGLLHDLGSFAVLRVVDEYTKTHGREISEPLFDRLCEEWHEHLGLRLANEWNLPDPLLELIGNHSRPPADGDPLAHHRHLLQFAELACSMLGYATYVPHDIFAASCVRGLGLTNSPVTWEKLTTLPDQIQERLAGF